MSEFEHEKDRDESWVSSFEEMFDNFADHSGWTLSIYREQPKDLSGFLEEIELEPGENPIDMKYLINQWGGKMLRLMLRDDKGVYRKRMLIPLKSYPPRVNGKLCNAPDDTPQKDPKRELVEYLELIRALKPEVPVVQNSLDVLLPIFAPILKIVAEKAMTPPLIPQIPSQAASMTDTLTALQAMREFVQPPGESDFGSTMLSLAEKVLPLIANKNQNPQQMPIVLPPISPVSIQEKIDPSEVKVTSNPEPIPMTIDPNISEPTDEQMFSFLQKKLNEGQIGGEELSKLYFDTLAGLSDDERRKAEVYLENELGLEPLDENSPEDIPTPISRGAASTNKRNNTDIGPSDKKGG